MKLNREKRETKNLFMTRVGHQVGLKKYFNDFIYFIRV